MQKGKPDPEVPGGAKATFKQGNATKIEVPVKYFVDDWFHCTFEFRVSEGVARLNSVEHNGETYWFRENEPAREKAYRVVEELPFVSEVRRLYD